MDKFIKRIDRISSIGGLCFILYGLMPFVLPIFFTKHVDSLQQANAEIRGISIITIGVGFLIGGLTGKPVLQKFFIRKDLNYNNVAVMTLYALLVGLLIILGVIFFFNPDSLKILIDFIQNIGKEI